MFLGLGFYLQYQASTCFAIHLLAAQVWAVGGGTGETVVIVLGCFRAGVFNRSPRGRCGCFESVRHNVFGLFVFANRRPKAGRKLRKRFGSSLILRSVRWTSFDEFVTLRPSCVFVFDRSPRGRFVCLCKSCATTCLFYWSWCGLPPIPSVRGHWLHPVANTRVPQTPCSILRGPPDPP